MYIHIYTYIYIYIHIYVYIYNYIIIQINKSRFNPVKDDRKQTIKVSSFA